MPAQRPCRFHATAFRGEWNGEKREVSQRSTEEKVEMLLALAVILLVLAVVGGIAVHPLLFVIAVLALLVFFGGRRSLA
jgi:Flp pilus assembly protein TadB